MPATDTALFRSLTATRAELDSVLRDQIELIQRPEGAGWEGRVGAAVTLPLTGASAVLVSLAHLAIASTDEGEWNRMFSKTDADVSEPAAGETY